MSTEKSVQKGKIGVHSRSNLYHSLKNGIFLCMGCKTLQERARNHVIGNRLRKYGLNEATYREMLKKQGGGCAICGSKGEATKVTVDHEFLLHIDHCHTTGAVRGLLCRKCNTALGWLESSPNLIERIQEYVSRASIH